MLLCLVLSACGLPGGRARALEAAREQWNTNRPTAYSMTFEVSCGLCYWQTDETTVLVDGFMPVDAQKVLRPEDVTVDVLFDALESNIASHPQTYRVSYDEELGYPVSIDIDGDSSVIDDDWIFELLDFTPVD